VSDFLNAFPQYPDCMFCSDGGVTFDEFNGYRWCKCANGVRRQALEPETVSQANAARARVTA